jgi:hypothetical protein
MKLLFSKDKSATFLLKSKKVDAGIYLTLKHGKQLRY